MKRLLILLGFISVSAAAQKLPDDGFDKVRIVTPEKTIQAYLRPVTDDPGMEPDRLYYWYSGNSIHATQGGFSGRLLNGPYSEYYPNKNLKELGNFKKGLKDGTWRSWNDKGMLLQLYTWKSGLKSGKFSLFDEDGKLKQSGSFRRGQVDGLVKNYGPNASVTQVIYQDGVIVPGRSKATFWERVNIFKKK
jgi:antitoxin component YwqK of YwqJK toxin-antitoxin module